MKGRVFDYERILKFSIGLRYGNSIVVNKGIYYNLIYEYNRLDFIFLN